jgi:hypothetical protein
MKDANLFCQKKVELNQVMKQNDPNSKSVGNKLEGIVSLYFLVTILSNKKKDFL